MTVKQYLDLDEATEKCDRTAKFNAYQALPSVQE